MTESVYKVIELIGTSKDSWEKASAAAVERAGKSLRDLRVAEVVQLDLQLDAMHNEFYTSMATQGWEMEMGKLADIIEKRRKS